MQNHRENDPRKRFRKAKLQEKEHRMPVEKRYYDTFDMIQLFNVHPRTLQRWRTEGKIPYKKISGRVYYHAENIDDLMRENDGGEP